MRPMLIYATTLCLLAAVASATKSVRLLVNGHPRHPGAVASVYQGPATYNGHRKGYRSSSPYIIVSRHISPNCGSHFRNIHQQYFNYHNNYNRPNSNPLVESGRHFSYKKRPMKPKIHSAIKMMPHYETTLLLFGHSVDNHPTNLQQPEFKGNWKIIKPPEKEDANGRVVTYNRDGTRMLPEPIYNYHTRLSQLQWSPLQKLHRFDGHEQQTQVEMEKRAPTSINVTPSTTTSSPQTTNNELIFTALPAFYDNHFSSSDASNMIANGDIDNISTTEASFHSHVNNVTEETVTTKVPLTTVAKSKNEGSTIFFTKIGQNAKNVLSQLFGNFLNGRKQSNNFKINMSNSDSQLNNKLKNHSNVPLDQSNPIVDNQQNQKKSEFQDNFNQQSDTIDSNETNKLSNNKTSSMEIRFSEEVDPTSIYGWRPLSPIKDGHQKTPPTPSNSVINLMLSQHRFTKYSNDTIEEQESLLTDNSTIDTNDNNTLYNFSEVTTVPNNINEPSSPIDWLFGSINDPSNKTSNEEFAFDSLSDFAVAKPTFIDTKANTSTESGLFDDGQPSNVTTIILVPHSNWSDISQLTNEENNIKVNVYDKQESIGNTTRVTKRRFFDEVKQLYQKVKFGIPFPFDFLQSVLTYL